MSKDQWLETPIQFESEYTIYDILTILTNKTWKWIESQDDLLIQLDYDSFKKEFINFIYTKYHIQ